MIRNVKEADIKELAPIYKDLYDDVDIGEYWTIESSEKLLRYWYEKQKDLFFVAEENNQIIGAVVSGVKPWFDGNRLIDTEIFVSKKHQGKHIARELYKKHFEEAKRLYDCVTIEFHTYGDENEFPQSWYKRIGFKKDDELIIMNASIDKLLRSI